MTDPVNPPLPKIDADPRRIRVLFGGHEVADTRNAVVVREPGRRPVWYFPPGDVETTVLARAKTKPVVGKGTAVYFTINRDAHVIEEAAWSFEDPPSPFVAIGGYIAFRPVHFEFSAEGHTAAEWDLDEMAAGEA